MIEIEKVVSCPVTKATRGIIEIEPDVISQLAGAVWDKDEWMTIGLGERKEGGLRVIIDELWTPPKQIRKSSHVRPYKGDEPTEEEMFPDWVLERMVCGIHSHHTMSAKFSGSFNSKGDGDLSNGGICSNFATSIVIATPRHTDQESQLLGFEYEAVGAHEHLSCGEMGVSQFKIVPRGVEDWPFKHELVRANHKMSVESMGDCPNAMAYGVGNYKQLIKGECGVELKHQTYRRAVFGSEGLPILSQLPEPERAAVVVYNYGHGHNNTKPLVNVGGYWEDKKRKEEEEERKKIMDDLGDYANEEWYQAYCEYMYGRD